MIQGIVAQDTAVISAPPAGYAAHAVHFAGSHNSLGPTYLSRSSLACTNNGILSFSYWIKGIDSSASTSGTALWVSDPSNYDTFHTLSLHSATQGWHEIALTASNTLLQVFVRFPALSGSGWHHVLGSANTNLALGSKKFAIYYDDVLQTAQQFDDADPAFVINLNALPFYFGDDNFAVDGPTMDVCDVWIAPGVSLLSGSGPLRGSIDEATRRQFTDFDTGIGCIPIDPTTFPSSAILFTGGPSTFATNLGTGGAFTLTGSLTAASTSPP